MTNKEAIEVLQSMKLDFPLPKAAQTRRAQNDALDVAIEALKAEPCEDAISRRAAIEALHDEMIRKWTTEDTDDDGTLDEFNTEAILRRLPSVWPERKQGKWIYHIDDIFPAESTMECNQCHAKQPLTCDDEYCPHCGARMEGKE